MAYIHFPAYLQVSKDCLYHNTCVLFTALLTKIIFLQRILQVTVQPLSNSRRFCAIFSAKTRVERRSPHSRSEFSMGERKLLFTPSIGRE